MKSDGNLRALGSIVTYRVIHLKRNNFKRPKVSEEMANFEIFSLHHTGHYICSLQSHGSCLYLSGFKSYGPSPKKGPRQKLRPGFFGKNIPKSAKDVVEPSFRAHFFRPFMRFQKWYGLSPNSNAFIPTSKKPPTETAKKSSTTKFSLKFDQLHIRFIHIRSGCFWLLSYWIRQQPFIPQKLRPK